MLNRNLNKWCMAKVLRTVLMSAILYNQ